MKNTQNLSAQLSNSDSEFLKSALFLELIGQEPITINRAFVDLTGRTLAYLCDGAGASQRVGGLFRNPYVVVMLHEGHRNNEGTAANLPQDTRGLGHPA